MRKVTWYIIRGLVGGLLGFAAVVSPVMAGQPAAYTQEHTIIMIFRSQ